MQHVITYKLKTTIKHIYSNPKENYMLRNVNLLIIKVGLIR